MPEEGVRLIYVIKLNKMRQLIALAFSLYCEVLKTETEFPLFTITLSQTGLQLANTYESCLTYFVYLIFLSVKQ